MKKSLIAAGAASAVLAAMPVLGVFAAPVMTVTDTLQVTVSTSCTLDNDGDAATDPSIVGTTYTGSGAPGQLVTLAGSGATSTTVQIECNDADGYDITPTFSSLVGPTGSTAITYAANASAGSGTWTAYYSKNSGEATAFTASGTAVHGNPTMSDTYTFSYKVGLGNDQAAGTYEGTALYTLAATN